MNPVRRLFGHLLGGMGTVGLALFFLVFSCTQKLPTSPSGRPAAPQTVSVNNSSGEPEEKTSRKYLEAPDEFVVEPGAEVTATFNPDSLDYATIETGEAVEKSVGPSGYIVKFPIGTKDTALLVVPDGALHQNWNLSLRANLVPTRDEKMSVAMYDFFPEGLVYSKDCYLVQPCRYPDGTLVVLSWFNPDSGKWEEESVARVQNGQAVFVIKHFSKYGAPYDGLGSGGQ